MPVRFYLGVLLLFAMGCSSSSTPLTVDAPPQSPHDRSSSESNEAVSAHAGVPVDSALSLPSRRKPQTQSFPHFSDVAESVGVQFTYENGEMGKVLMVEAMGGGVGWIDFDRDDLLDVYLCQGGNPVAPADNQQPSDQLFRQVTGESFEMVSPLANVNEWRYSLGVSVADFDDDGFDDVYVTNLGPNSLLHNQGDGTFVEIGLNAGVADPSWGASSAWSDLDGDGDLDLYVCNYVDYDVHHPVPCVRLDGRPGTCHPKNMTGVPDECYFNQGDGTFTSEALSRGLFGPENKGLGVVIADLNNDGLPDIYVTNDTSPNFLFINQGQGRFVESAKPLGCAVSREGAPQASMGIGLSDFDRNGWLDLYSTHFTKESNTLYKNLGPGGFQDVTGIVGLHTPTLPYLGFGTVMCDFNQDGRDDIFVTNGHIDDWRTQGELHQMPAQLFSFEGPRFAEASSQGGEIFQREVLGRGVAYGDYDNDGDWDLMVVHQKSLAALLKNDSVRGNWIKLRCNARNNRRGVGTRVVLQQGERMLMQEISGGTSYCAAHEAALIFGLGDNASPCTLTIRWPDGTEQNLLNVETNQSLVVRQQPE